MSFFIIIKINNKAPCGSFKWRYNYLPFFPITFIFLSSSILFRHKLGFNTSKDMFTAAPYSLFTFAFVVDEGIAIGVHLRFARHRHDELGLESIMC